MITSCVFVQSILKNNKMLVSFHHYIYTKVYQIYFYFIVLHFVNTIVHDTKTQKFVFMSNLEPRAIKCPC